MPSCSALCWLLSSKINSACCSFSSFRPFVEDCVHVTMALPHLPPLLSKKLDVATNNLPSLLRLGAPVGRGVVDSLGHAYGHLLVYYELIGLSGRLAEICVCAFWSRQADRQRHACACTCALHASMLNPQSLSRYDQFLWVYSAFICKHSNGGISAHATGLVAGKQPTPCSSQIVC